MQKACVIRLSALGDVVLTTGVLDFWHRTRGTSFVFVTRKQFSPVLEGNPAVSEIVALGPAQLSHWWRTALNLSRAYAGIPLIDLHGTLRTRLLGLLWSGPVHSFPKFTLERHLLRRVRLHALRERLLSANITQRYAFPLENAFVPKEELLPRIHLREKELSRAEHILEQAGVSGPAVVLHPYATHPGKAWPRGHWHQLIALLERRSIDWIIVGRSPEPLFGETEEPRDFTNRTELRLTCALLHRCGLMVSNDSGPMHLATAVSTPVLALFGPTSAEWGFAPSGPRDRVLSLGLGCSPCSLHGRIRCSDELRCMRQMLPETVLSEILVMRGQGHEQTPLL
jgi:ADP-heptose:LPS heptosyltransferase